MILPGNNTDICLQIALFFYFSFLILQKRNKKGAPKSMTARFRVGSLIKLLYYCDFCIGNSTLRKKWRCIAHSTHNKFNTVIKFTAMNLRVGIKC